MTVYGAIFAFDFILIVNVKTPNHHDSVITVANAVFICIW